MRRHPFTFTRLVVEVVILVLLGNFFIDPVGTILGFDTSSGEWFVTRFVLYMVAFWTFMPGLVDKILDTVEVYRK